MRVLPVWILLVDRVLLDHSALLERIWHRQTSWVAQLLVTHCKDLICHNQDCRLDWLAWILGHLGQRLVEIEPTCTELIHSSLELGCTLVVESLRGSHSICHIEKRENLPFEASIGSQ